MNCVLIDDDIRNLAKELGRSEKRVQTAVGAWQNKNNTTDLPTKNDLLEFWNNQTRISTYVEGHKPTASTHKNSILVVPGSDVGFMGDAYRDIKERGYDRDPRAVGEGLDRDTYNLQVVQSGSSKKAPVKVRLNSNTGIWAQATENTALHADSTLSSRDLESAKNKYPEFEANEEILRNLTIAEKGDKIFLIKGNSNISYLEELKALNKPLYVYQNNEWEKWDVDNQRFVKAPSNLKITKSSALLANDEGLNTRRINSETFDKNSWGQTSNGIPNYEVSTAGDARVSAHNATFALGTTLFGHDVGGRTIESVYQHGVKQGDWSTDNNLETGNPSDATIIKGNDEEAAYQAYKYLYQVWANQNPELIRDLEQKAKGKILTDQDSSTAISQARALAEILSELNPEVSEEVQQEYLDAANQVIEKTVNTETSKRTEAEIQESILKLFNECEKRENRYKKFYISDFVPEGASYTENDIINALVKVAAEQDGIPTNLVIPERWALETEDFENIKNKYRDSFKTFTDVQASPQDFEKVHKELTAAEEQMRTNTIAFDFCLRATDEYNAYRSELQDRMDEGDESAAEEWYTISKEDFLTKKADIKGIIQQIRQGWEDRINPEYKNEIIQEDIMTDYAYRNLTDEQAEEIYEQEAAKIRAILNNFEYLVNLASKRIEEIEHIKISYTQNDTKNTTTDSNGVDVQDREEDETSDGESAENTKDGWMFKWSHIKARDSLSKETKAILSELYELDTNGDIILDDLRCEVPVDSIHAHTILLKVLKDMTSPEELLPKLEEASKQYLWIKSIIDKIGYKEGSKWRPLPLHAVFYSDMRKNTLNLWGTRKKYDSDGTWHFETFQLSRPEGASTLINTWRRSFDSRNFIAGKDSIFTSKGGISEENCEKYSKECQDILDNLTTTKEGERSERGQKVLARNKDLQTSILKLFEKANISINTKEFEDLFRGNPKVVVEALEELQKVFDYSKKYTLSKNKDAFSIVQGRYWTIANALSYTVENLQEDQIYHQGSSYYTHVNPGFLTTAVMKLKGEQRKKYIEEQYMPYDFFYNSETKEWRDPYIKRLYERPNEDIDHKVVLTHNYKEYNTWTAIDHFQLKLAEFEAFDQEENGDYFWAQTPILSDVESAQFIKVRKYKDIKKMLPILTSTVMQELSRIHTVRERRKLGLPKEREIANYDTGRGDRFCFFEELNDFYVVPKGRSVEVTKDNSDENAVSLKEFLMDLYEKNQEPNKLKSIIEKAVQLSQKLELSKAIRQWERDGVFKTDKKGDKYVNLPYEVSESEKEAKGIVKEFNENYGTSLSFSLADALEDFETATSNSLIEKARTALKKQGYEEKEIDDIIREELVDPIKDTLSTTYSTGKTEYFGLLDTLEKFYWNQSVALANIIKLSTTDLAFYKNMEDFQKRYKEVHAPASKVDTTAVWETSPGNYETIGTDTEKVIYLSDEEYKTAMYDEVKKLYGLELAAGRMTIREFNSKLKSWKATNITDGQSFRSLYGYRKICIMSGQWSMKMENSYKHIKAGKWTIEDFNTVWQTKKPYYYGPESVDSGLQGNQLKVPVQHKNSEFLLLAATIAASKSNSALGHSAKLVGLNNFMEKHQVDAVVFTSAVKVGASGAVDTIAKRQKDGNFQDADLWKNTQSADAYEQYLENATMVNGEFKQGILHELDFNNYGFQTATPEHFIDVTQGIGTQFRKLILADLSPDATFTVEGLDRKLNKGELLDYYQRVTTLSIMESFKNLEKRFQDPKEVERILKDEIVGNDRYPNSLVEACTYDEKTGKFFLPLEDEVQSTRIQQLFTSILKKQVTKQTTKGGSLIQVSCFGVESDEDFKVHYKKNDRGEEDPTLGIEYTDAYLPMSSKQFFEPFMDRNGNLDITKMPENLRRAIGYRVPTEAKYSMIPIRIAGFLPQANGSAIMLPREITTLTGSDFDVDKLFIMLPEFKKAPTYNINKAWSDFYEENPDISNKIQDELEKSYTAFKASNPKYKGTVSQYWTDILSQDIKTDKKYKLVEGTQNKFQEWFASRKKDYFREYKFKKVVPNYNDAFANSREQRNNMLFDLSWSVLTDPTCTADVLTPGGFQEQSRAARIVTALENVPYEDIKKLEKEAKKHITAWDIEDLDNLIAEYKTNVDALNCSTYMNFHQQNMVGAGMIGIYAVASSAHAVAQHTRLSIHDEAKFSFAGQTKTSLHEIYADSKQKGRKISEALRNYIAASVDNVKDNTLSATNQNKFTVNVSTMLARLGYTNVEIGLLMNQPIIKDMVRSWHTGQAPYKAIITTIDRYKKAVGLEKNLKYNLETQEDYASMQSLLDGIGRGQDANVDLLQDDIDFDNLDEDDIDFYEQQAFIGLLFQQMTKVSDDLSKLARITRQDTSNNASGPFISNDIAQQYDIYNYAESHQDSTTLDYTGDVLPSSFDISAENLKQNEEGLLEEIMKGKYPLMDAFYNFGVKGSRELFKKYFPMHYRTTVTDALFDEGYRDSLVNLAGTELSDTTIGAYFEQLSLYKIMGLEDFNAPTAEERAEKRLKFVYEFEDYFKEFLKNHPELNELQFIQNLEWFNIKKDSKIRGLKFKNEGVKMQTSLKNLFTRQWEEISTMDDTGECAQFAKLLFMHDLFTRGFAYSADNKVALCPPQLRKSIPGYSEVYEQEETMREMYKFNLQFILNNLQNPELCPIVSNASTVVTSNTIFDQNKNIDINNETGKITGTLAKSFAIGINKKSSFADKSFLKSETHKANGEVEYKFKHFVNIKINGKSHYYALQSESLSGTATYRHIRPLGIQGKYYEYEYDSMPNYLNYTPTEQEQSGITDDFMHTVYNSEEQNYETRVTKSLNEEEDTADNFEGDDEGAAWARIANSADPYYQMLRIEMEHKQSTSNIEANVNKKDDEGNIVCK